MPFSVFEKITNLENIFSEEKIHVTNVHFLKKILRFCVSGGDGQAGPGSGPAPVTEDGSDRMVGSDIEEVP